MRIFTIEFKVKIFYFLILNTLYNNVKDYILSIQSASLKFLNTETFNKNQILLLAIQTKQMLRTTKKRRLVRVKILRSYYLLLVKIEVRVVSLQKPTKAYPNRR